MMSNLKICEKLDLVVSNSLPTMVQESVRSADDRRDQPTGADLTARTQCGLVQHRPSSGTEEITVRLDKSQFEYKPRS